MSEVMENPASYTRNLTLSGKYYELIKMKDGGYYNLFTEFSRDVVNKDGNKVRTIRARRRLSPTGPTYRVVLEFFKEDFPEFFQNEVIYL